jgi:hypothetical protein
MLLELLMFLEIFTFIKIYASGSIYIWGIIFVEPFMLFDNENDYAVANPKDNLENDIWRCS